MASVLRPLVSSLALLSLVGVLAGGCARLGNNGEACSAPGLDPSAFGGCAQGLVCAPDSSPHTGRGAAAAWDSATCRTVCYASAECPDGFTCSQVSGTDYRMACLPR